MSSIYSKEIQHNGKWDERDDDDDDDHDDDHHHHHDGMSHSLNPSDLYFMRSNVRLLSHRDLSHLNASCSLHFARYIIYSIVAALRTSKSPNWPHFSRCVSRRTLCTGQALLVLGQQSLRVRVYNSGWTEKWNVHMVKRPWVFNNTALTLCKGKGRTEFSFSYF